MVADDKSEFLRVRVSKETKEAFEQFSAELGKSPSDQLRDLVDAFIHEEAVRANKDVVVTITRPPGYDLGAWLVKIKVLDPNAVSWMGKPFGFLLPELPRRRIQSDATYLAAILAPGGEIKLGGHFVDGVWQGHLYSNGIEEDRNPTSIDAVHKALERVTRDLITSLKPGS